MGIIITKVITFTDGKTESWEVETFSEDQAICCEARDPSQVLQISGSQIMIIGPVESSITWELRCLSPTYA